ncbi:MAG: putative ORFan [Satyrvirus sp.]|uniref:Putative ORFan n=1 Tax=Satyrvirus sp. TaxID=2487771 RepID=A0A3G5ACS0_9VIRU|nr:MAG: putative ORFan [Satyrvirus sp.]
MDTIIAGLVAGCSIISLGLDYRKRQNFNSFISTGSNNNFRLVRGVVTTKEPILFETDNGIVSAFCKRIETRIKNTHTYIVSEKINLNGVKIKIPWLHIIKSWVPDTIETTISNNVFLGNFHLFLTKNTSFSWDKLKTSQTENTKKFTEYMENEKLRTVFGELSDANSNGLITKHVGDDNFVIQKIRSDHYNINDPYTFLLSGILVFSLGYFANNLYSGYPRKRR